MQIYTPIKLDKQTGNGTVLVPYTSDSRHLTFSIHADVSTSATIKVMGSIQRDVPNFGAANSSTNDFQYLASRNLENASLINGTTGVTIAATTHHATYEVESNAVAHLAFEITGFSGDGITIVVLTRND